MVCRNAVLVFPVILVLALLGVVLLHSADIDYEREEIQGVDSSD